MKVSDRGCPHSHITYNLSTTPLNFNILVLYSGYIINYKFKDSVLLDDVVQAVGQTVRPGQGGAYHSGQLAGPHLVDITELADPGQVGHQVEQGQPSNV